MYSYCALISDIESALGHLICVLLYRVYDPFTLEAILSTGFGRQVDIQLGESDEFAKAMSMATASFAGGQLERLLLLSSKITSSVEHLYCWGIHCTRR